MNKEIKERFVKEKYEGKSNEFFIKQSFMNAEEYEYMIGKDIYDWSLNDITSFYKSLGSSSKSRLENINSFYNNYTKWAIKNNMVNDFQNNFDLVDSDILISCLNKRNLNSRIITRKEVFKCLEILPNPSDQFILLALFEGIYGKRMEEIINMKLSDIDMKTRKVRLYSGRIVEMSKELIKYAIHSEEEYEYLSISGQERTTKFIHKKDNIIKPKTNSQSLNISLNYRVKNIVKFYGWSKNIVPKSIVMSGKIDMINRRKKELGISTEEYLSIYKKELEEKYPSTRIYSNSNFIKMFKDYL